MYFPVDTDLKEKFNKSGILPGQKIAVLCSNSDYYAKLLMQIIFTGGVVIPVSPVMPVSKVHRILRNIGCFKIIADEHIEYKDDEFIKSVSFQYFHKELSKIDLKKTINVFNIEKYEEFRDRYASIFLTSGTTNSPKAVLHTFNNHWYSAIGSNINILFKIGDCWMVGLPLSHVSGFSTIFKALAGKADIYIKPSGITIAEALKTNNDITHISLIPSQLSELLSEKSGAELLRKLKAVLIGGAPASARLIEKSKTLGLNIYNSYGSTEMSSQITCSVRNDSLKNLKTSGKLLKFREIKISSENEIMVKGKTLFAGYIKTDNTDNHELFKSVDKEGWFATNDLGFIDDEESLHVIGRKDLMFVFNGENIFPEEIEGELREIKEIEDALVVPSGENNETQKPAAFLKMKNKLKPDYDAIEKSLLKKLERYKIPDIYFDWPEDLTKNLLKPDREIFKKRAVDLMKKYHKKEIKPTD
ncbi:MAG: AMP-binding protein [Actinomycetota bacterium]